MNYRQGQERNYYKSEKRGNPWKNRARKLCPEDPEVYEFI